MARALEKLWRLLSEDVREEVVEARQKMRETSRQAREARAKLDGDMPFRLLASVIEGYGVHIEDLEGNVNYNAFPGVRSQLEIDIGKIAIGQVREIEGYGGVRGVELEESRLLYEDGVVYEGDWPELGEEELVSAEVVVKAYQVSEAYGDKYDW